MSSKLPPHLDQLVNKSLAARRPILHHLNADTTWLLQLPRPDLPCSTDSAGTSPNDGRGARRWFNILLDPWLSGSQSDVASWFSSQSHAIEPFYPTIGEVEELCRKVEELSAPSSHSQSAPSRSPARSSSRLRSQLRSQSRYGPHENSSSSESEHLIHHSPIDAIAISHEFTDHCHQATLLECSPLTPVFATTKAYSLIRSWNHFENVVETPSFSGGDWRQIDIGGEATLPPWVRIGRLVTQQDNLYYHSAVLLCFDLASPSPPSSGLPLPSLEESQNAKAHDSDDFSATGAECLIYTPHGIHAPSLLLLTTASPPISTLAFLHGLHDISISWMTQLNLGAQNGLMAMRVVKAKYWIGTHDEVKNGGGLVSWFLRRRVLSVKEAMAKLDQLEKKTGGSLGGEQGEVEEVDREMDVENEKVGDGEKYLELGNGEGVVLG